MPVDVQVSEGKILTNLSDAVFEQSDHVFKDRGNVLEGTVFETRDHELDLLTKRMVDITNVRRMLEEYSAKRHIVNLLVLENVLTVLSGKEKRLDGELGHAVHRYLKIVIRNRIYLALKDLEADSETKSEFFFVR